MVESNYANWANLITLRSSFLDLTETWALDYLSVPCFFKVHQLSQLRHENIIRLYGVCSQKPKVSQVNRCFDVKCFDKRN